MRAYFLHPLLGGTRQGRSEERKFSSKRQMHAAGLQHGIWTFTVPTISDYNQFAGSILEIALQELH
jgi:hypothetical protein